jgi:phosphoribosylformimino-5-aminoimidazole carboxamide ribotide isomerase
MGAWAHGRMGAWAEKVCTHWRLGTLMFIPAIDLKDGQVVQLVQGKRLALASDDVFAWVERFKNYPKVQVIDLDGALESGANDFLVRRICKHLPCRVGGGIRSIARAESVLEAGATHVIVSSVLFRDARLDLDFARALADRVGRERIIAAVDSFGGKVVIRGWTEATLLTAPEAAQELEPFCGEFLYTHVDTEGLMRGIDMTAVSAVRQATSRPLTAAGGITTREEILALDAMGVDAVVGMAVYTGTLSLDDEALRPPAAR